MFGKWVPFDLQCREDLTPLVPKKMMSPGADLLIQPDMFQLFLERKDELDKKFCVLEIFVSDLLRKFVLLVHSTRV